MNAKSKAYIDALYRSKMPKAPKAGAFVAYGLYSAIIGLGVWGLFYNGPALALRAAHTLTWIAIVLGIIGFGALVVTHFMAIKLRRMSPRIADTILFASTRGNQILKFIACLPLPATFAIAILANWSVAAVFVGILIFLSIANKSINKMQQNSRIEEIEATEAFALDNSLASEEDLKNQINDAFRRE